jgi:hypothetical protein
MQRMIFNEKRPRFLQWQGVRQQRHHQQSGSFRWYARTRDAQGSNEFALLELRAKLPLHRKIKNR